MTGGESLFESLARYSADGGMGQTVWWNKDGDGEVQKWDEAVWLSCTQEIMKGHFHSAIYANLLRGGQVLLTGWESSFRCEFETLHGHVVCSIKPCHNEKCFWGSMKSCWAFRGEPGGVRRGWRNGTDGTAEDIGRRGGLEAGGQNSWSSWNFNSGRFKNWKNQKSTNLDAVKLFKFLIRTIYNFKEVAALISNFSNIWFRTI